MDGNFKPYSYVDSSARIADILNQPAGQFEEVDALPDRDRLTYANGFYGRCSAIFIDIRDSSALTTKYKRPALAKLYRAFISEMVAALNSDPYVREVNIVGDCVWATYNTPRKSDIDDVFTVACRANTLSKLLNKHLSKRGYDELTLGIGVDWGRVLMIKAGYNGSGLNDVVYMGDVVNRAAHLAHKAGRGWTSKPMWVGHDFNSNLNVENAQWLTSQYDTELGTVCTGNVILTTMSEWIDENIS
ncbi:adenylate/guanylate cyclase domain-containing protein [Flexivirga meconopsidis]|uniref:adenylate/guanylate cyclase domain-containing protein n=1 Tax=Flexivirga meconopsidis TaxID=2977121 RepID=UPI00223ECF19|nr:adenylate/guanylate cyclase domain-containing protein [Flexivirga meconopsidis]